MVFPLVATFVELARSVLGRPKPKLTLEEITRSAEQGDAEVENNLGVMYAQGEGVAQDYA